jgi:hypothetical protein
MRHGQAVLHAEEVEGRGSITPDAAGASGGSLHIVSTAVVWTSSAPVRGRLISCTDCSRSLIW